MFINENAAFSINDLMPLIEESIKSGQKVKMQVSGISMTPLLHDVRDAVVLEKPDKLKKYDIVLHRRENGQYILHRIIKKKGDVLTIAGDFETEKEYPVYEKQVIAKVTSFRRNGKEYKVTDFIIRLYSRLWLLIFPQRQNVLYLINVIRRKLHV